MLVSPAVRRASPTIGKDREPTLDRGNAALRALRLSLLLLLCVPSCGYFDRARPNVVLIVVDTLRADHLGTYGFPAETSPNVDALATESALFERAIAASAVTAPSHASIMTSRFVRGHTVGFHNGYTRLRDEETLALAFQRAGYDTAAFISNFVIQARTGLDRGFDIYDDELPQAERNRPRAFERTAQYTTERAIAWLQNREERPFFLWVHYQDPHGPYTPPSPYDEGLPVPAIPDEQPLPVQKAQRGWQGIPAYQALPDKVLPSQYQGLYAAEIRHFDDWLGRLLVAVDAAGGGRESVLLLTSDHGESLGENDFYFAHGHATTPDLSRVPLLLRAPGISPGRHPQIVHHVDILPTLLELAGLPTPESAEGIALGPLLRDGTPLPERLVYCDIGTEVSAYRGDFFMRVRAPQGRAGPDSTSWLTHRWSRGGRLQGRDDGRVGADWELVPSDRTDRPEISEYLRQDTPVAPAASRSEADIERLRALGYVDPAAERE